MKRFALLSAAVLVPLLLAGCSSGSKTTTSSATTQASTTSTTSGATSTTKAGSTTSSTAPSNLCATTELSAELGPTNAGAGQLYQPLILTNTGNRTCETRGFPGVSILDASGTQIGQPAQREGNEGPTVSLAPGKTASALLHTANEGIPGAPCEATSAKMKVYPPGQTASITFDTAYKVCGSWTVGTLYAGDTGMAP